MNSNAAASDRQSSLLLCSLWVALSLSIGWGIRGNFGHEYGAMTPGVLATVAAVLLIRRPDWHRQIFFFAFFGGLGWSFGGSISYMQVIGYTHSGDSVSVLYGFACLFVIGFLWAAFGGAGSALPAVLSRERLLEFFWPLVAVFTAWTIQDRAVARFDDSDYRHQSPLYWFDTDWLGVLVAMGAVLLLALCRRRLDRASSLILHMGVGWWAGFLLLVVLMDWRMTPPRGDNWAGCVGMVIGMWVYFQRHQLSQLTFASLLTGLVGGFGFATASLLKLIGMTSGWQTNWHSVLEQTYGFINGAGVAAALFWMARRLPLNQVEPQPPRSGFWKEGAIAAFVLLGITYLNLQKNPEVWVNSKAMPESMYGVATTTWFALTYVALTIAFFLCLAVHRKQSLALLPNSWLGRGQALYLGFLWIMVVGNFLRAVVGFAPQRMITEGVIFLNAILCTVGLLATQPLPAVAPAPALAPASFWPQLVRKTAWVGALAIALSIVADWGLIRAIYGQRQGGHASKHIRFGPNATATKDKPSSTARHP